MQTLQDTFWSTRLDAMAAYKKLFCQLPSGLTSEGYAKLHREYQRAWQAYKNADIELFEYEARQETT